MAGTGIHPSACIAAGARLGANCSVGPFAIIEEDVELGSDCEIRAHAVIKRYTRMGDGNRVFEHAVIGGEPQDINFEGEPSFVQIGHGNLIREGATIHRGSAKGAATRVGDGNFLMAYSHVAHDCVIGNQTVIANGALVAGFVAVGDRAFISGNVTIHQFARVGRLAMVGGLARISRDCLPFMITEGSPARIRGVNLVGLRRAGIEAGEVASLKKALTTLRTTRLLQEALTRLEDSPSAAVREIAQFIHASRRGFTHARGG